MQIRKEMAEFWGVKGVVIYSTGSLLTSTFFLSISIIYNQYNEIK